MNITITIPDELYAKIINSFATRHNYKEQIPNPEYDGINPDIEEFIDNPLTKDRLFKNKVIEYIQNEHVAETSKISKVAQEGFIEVLKSQVTDISIE